MDKSNSKSNSLIITFSNDFYKFHYALSLASTLKATGKNITIFVSGMSAKARGYDESLLDGYKAEFAMPDRLVEESIKSDSVLCYWEYLRTLQKVGAGK